MFPFSSAWFEILNQLIQFWGKKNLERFKRELEKIDLGNLKMKVLGEQLSGLDYSPQEPRLR